MKHLILIDFDGTITEKDTLIEFAKFSKSGLLYLINIIYLLPSMMLMKANLIGKQKGKEIFLRTFYGELSEADFNDQCKSFAIKKIPKVIRPLALEKLRIEKKSKNRVVIVSASPENWIKPWAEKLNIEVIATRLKFENNRLKGISGKNCNGEEKVRRIKQEIDLSKYNKVIAYGDTKGDLPMLALAEEKHYKPFR